MNRLYVSLFSNSAVTARQRSVLSSTLSCCSTVLVNNSNVSNMNNRQHDFNLVIRRNNRSSIQSNWSELTARIIANEQPFRGYEYSMVGKDIKNRHMQAAKKWIYNKRKLNEPPTAEDLENYIEDVYLMDYQLSCEVYDKMCVEYKKPSQKVYALTILSCAMRNEWGIAGRIIKENADNPEYV